MEHITLSGSFWCQFDNINSPFNKWKKSTKNKEFLLLCIVPVRIIIRSRNQNINPLLCRKFLSSFSKIFKINNIRTKRAIINHFDITICFFGRIVPCPHQLHYSPVFTFFQKGILSARKCDHAQRFFARCEVPVKMQRIAVEPAQIILIDGPDVVRQTAVVAAQMPLPFQRGRKTERLGKNDVGQRRMKGIGHIGRGTAAGHIVEQSREKR